MLSRFLLVLVIVAFVALVPPPQKAEAIPLPGVPFGGRVVTPKLPITCTAPGKGPFMIWPSGGLSLPGPYIFPLPIDNPYKWNNTGIGAWVLGKYNPVPMLCLTNTVPPVTVPVWRINSYGSSRGIGL